MGEVCTKCGEVIYGAIEYDALNHPFHPEAIECERKPA